jgi:hypothetical protein
MIDVIDLTPQERWFEVDIHRMLGRHLDQGVSLVAHPGVTVSGSEVMKRASHLSAKRAGEATDANELADYGRQFGALFGHRL